MGLRKFGIKEAKRADTFAKTNDQRTTVLAVVRMLNIPIVIKEQVKAQVAKFDTAFKKKKAKIVKLERKLIVIDKKAAKDVLVKYDAVKIGDNWEF